MFWLRGLLFLLPLALGLAAVLLHREVGRLRLPPPGEVFTTSVQAPVGVIDPLSPGEGTAREINGLVFEPLLVRDREGRLRPNLLASWEERTLLTLLCASEEDAGEAEAEVLAASREGGALPGLPQARLLASERLGPTLNLAFSGSAAGVEDAVLALAGPERLGESLLVEVRLKHSARDSLRAFLSNSNERRRIAMLDYEGDAAALLFLRGDPEPLLRELELYYGANPSLEPEIRVAGPRHHVASRELLLTLRSGLRWHDGVEVSSADLLFSHARLASGDAALPLVPGLAEAFDYLESLEALDRHRLRAACREIPASFLESWERLPLLPAHFFEGADPEERWPVYLDRPVGCGPYLVASRRPDGGIELEAHEAWHLGTPPQGRLVYRRMESLEAKLLALRGGRLDSLVPDARFAEWARRHPGSVSARPGAPRFQHLVAWNLERAPFDREEVRLALAKAVDLDALLADGPGEFRSRPRRYFDLGLPGANPDADADAAATDLPPSSPPFDPGEAAALLEAEGLVPGEEGGGSERGAAASAAASAPRAFGFRLHFDESVPFHRELALGLARQWAAIGIEAVPVPVPRGRFEAGPAEGGGFDAVLLRREIPKGRDLRAAWGRGSLLPAGPERPSPRDPETGALLEALRLEPDEALLPAHAAALHLRLASRQPCLLLAESGRIWWFRRDGVAAGGDRPGRASGEAATPVEELGGLSGREFESSRPWWVRRRVDEGTPPLSDAGNGTAEAPPAAGLPSPSNAP